MVFRREYQVHDLFKKTNIQNLGTMKNMVIVSTRANAESWEARRNADVFVEKDVTLFCIPKEIYLKYWHFPLSAK